MLRLRTYKSCDAKAIVTWCKDEVSFRKWSADRWESYPLTEAVMNQKYMECNGDCEEEDNFYPMTGFGWIKKSYASFAEKSGVFGNWR